MHSKSIINRICESEDPSVGEVLRKARGIPEAVPERPENKAPRGFSYRKHLAGGGTYAEIRFEARINGKTVFRSDVGSSVGVGGSDPDMLKNDLEHIFDKIVGAADKEIFSRWGSRTYRDIED